MENEVGNDMDPRVEDTVRYHEAVYGESPPVRPEDLDAPRTAPDHKVDSILDEAEMGVVGFLEKEENVEEREEDYEVETDGGVRQMLSYAGEEVYTSPSSGKEYNSGGRMGL